MAAWRPSSGNRRVSLRPRGGGGGGGGSGPLRPRGRGASPVAVAVSHSRGVLVELHRDEPLLAPALVARCHAPAVLLHEGVGAQQPLHVQGPLRAAAVAAAYAPIGGPSAPHGRRRGVGRRAGRAVRGGGQALVVVVLEPAVQRANAGRPRHAAGLRRRSRGLWGGHRAAVLAGPGLGIAGTLRTDHHARVEADVHGLGATGVRRQERATGGLRRRLRCLPGAGGRRPRYDGGRLRLVHAAVLSHGKAHARPGAVVDGHEAPEEGVAKDEEGALRRRHVQRHEGEGAISGALVHVVVW
mmetsp:Transcript_114334/g.356036  ORF Transcript_114334/g.356036 Transcript_114334/m.356036 type:complete len:298 (-) Transcript_114334:724-1617(-)